MADITARIAGKWRIMETAIWHKQHLDQCGPAFIEFDTQGQGEMAFGEGWANLREGGCPKAESFTTTVTKLPSSPCHGRVFSSLLERFSINLVHTCTD